MISSRANFVFGERTRSIKFLYTSYPKISAINTSGLFPPLEINLIGISICFKLVHFCEITSCERNFVKYVN